jgi:hypothetical protein
VRRRGRSITSDAPIRPCSGATYSQRFAVEIRVVRDWIASFVHRGRFDDADDAASRVAEASTDLKCMMISAKMRCGSCFVNFNVVLIASMFVAAYKLFA